VLQRVLQGLLRDAIQVCLAFEGQAQIGFHVGARFDESVAHRARFGEKRQCGT